ncbi:Leucine-rich repeat [Trypanosoma melophagium]|uniref:Leucine-rich repeat n=1 Tax=Trypanosoma melophagium TaxID=715481 RepID=UPI00351A0403|nr:Leucine-rich repeat [Trypanosoma melophagium]
MGVGQSRELLGKVSDDRVFVCTNREDLLVLLSNMQNALMLENDVNTMEGENEERVVEESGNADNDHKDEGAATDEEYKYRKEEKQEEQREHEEEKIEDNEQEDEVQGEESIQSSDIVIVTPIEVIHVPNHYLGDEGLITGHPAVLQILAASTSLRSLNIGFNSLTSRSVAALLGNSIENPDKDDENGMNVNNGGIPPNLLSLNLAGNSIGREGCERLAEFLAQDPPLRELSLFHNGLYDSDVEPLLHALQKNTHLRLLNLDYNYLTGGFLHQLLELLREHNNTLAVVMFDGPYDMETFERKREIVRPEKIPDASKVGANARALLRQKLLRADLSGRIPFPADLVEEVENILAPRRAVYIAELEAEKEAMAEREAEEKAAALLALWGKNETCSPLSSSSSSNSFKDKEVTGLEEHKKMMGECEEEWEEEEKKKDENTSENGVDMMDNKVSDGSEGLHNGSINATDTARTGSIGSTTNSSKTKNAFIHTARPQNQYTVQFSNEGDGSFTMPRIKTNRGRSEASCTSATAAAAAASEAAQEWRTKCNIDSGKELSNGFDRLLLAPPVLAPGAKTVWHRVNGPPCRLRACWCDPRDAPVPYGGKLHYHCKHEPTGGELGDMGADGMPLSAKGKRVKGHQKSLVRRLTKATTATGGKGKKTTYEGCKETSHRCESLGFYGRPKPDMSSVYFFASPHPMQAASLVMDNEGD